MLSVGRLIIIHMRFRTYKNTDLTVSEVGFGLWTIFTGWWGRLTEGGAIAQLHFYLDDLFPHSLGRPLFGGNK